MSDEQQRPPLPIEDAHLLEASAAELDAPAKRTRDVRIRVTTLAHVVPKFGWHAWRMSVMGLVPDVELYCRVGDFELVFELDSWEPQL